MNNYPFDPFCDENSEILILGSYPGPNSRNEGFYYADKRNQFWRLLSEIYNETIPESREEKESFLKRHHIALWDVCKEADVTNANDNSLICNEKNEIKDLLEKCPNIKRILCAGRKAERLFRKYNKNLEYKYIISSSGSATKPYLEKKKQWEEAIAG